MINEIRILEILKEIMSQLPIKADNWMDIEAASEYAAVSPQTLRRAFTRGELRVSDKTGKRLFKKADVDRWLRDK
jgi:excisionase family DNA binding protein